MSDLILWFPSIRTLEPFVREILAPPFLWGFFVLLVLLELLKLLELLDKKYSTKMVCDK